MICFEIKAIDKIYDYRKHSCVGILHVDNNINTFLKLFFNKSHFFYCKCTVYCFESKINKRRNSR